MAVGHDKVHLAPFSNYVGDYNAPLNTPSQPPKYLKNLGHVRALDCTYGTKYPELGLFHGHDLRANHEFPALSPDKWHNIYFVIATFVRIQLR
jgi:hypothetical protein